MTQASDCAVDGNARVPVATQSIFAEALAGERDLHPAPVGNQLAWLMASDRLQRWCTIATLLAFQVEHDEAGQIRSSEQQRAGAGALRFAAMERFRLELCQSRDTFNRELAANHGHPLHALDRRVWAEVEGQLLAYRAELLQWASVQVGPPAGDAVHARAAQFGAACAAATPPSFLEADAAKHLHRRVQHAEDGAIDRLIARVQADADAGKWIPLEEVCAASEAQGAIGGIPIPFRSEAAWCRAWDRLVRVACGQEQAPQRPRDYPPLRDGDFLDDSVRAICPAFARRLPSEPGANLQAGRWLHRDWLRRLPTGPCPARPLRFSTCTAAPSERSPNTSTPRRVRAATDATGEMVSAAPLPPFRLLAIVDHLIVVAALADQLRQAAGRPLAWSDPALPHTALDLARVVGRYLAQLKRAEALHANAAASAGSRMDLWHHALRNTPADAGLCGDAGPAYMGSFHALHTLWLNIVAWSSVAGARTAGQTFEADIPAIGLTLALHGAPAHLFADLDDPALTLRQLSLAHAVARQLNGQQPVLWIPLDQIIRAASTGTRIAGVRAPNRSAPSFRQTWKRLKDHWRGDNEAGPKDVSPLWDGAFVDAEVRREHAVYLETMPPCLRTGNRTWVSSTWLEQFTGGTIAAPK